MNRNVLNHSILFKMKKAVKLCFPARQSATKKCKLKENILTLMYTAAIIIF